MITVRDELRAYKLLKIHFKKASLHKRYERWHTQPEYQAISIDTHPGICSIDSPDPMLAVKDLIRKAGKDDSTT